MLWTIFATMGCFADDDTPDVSHIDVQLDRVDYDDVFLSMNPEEDLKPQVETLRVEYPNMTDIYIRNVMQFQRPMDTTELYLADIKGFLSSPEVSRLKYTVDSVYNHRTQLDNGFKKAFQYLKYYFPERLTPRLYYLMSEYSYATFIFPESPTEDGLGVSLDMFLGIDYPYKDIFPTNPAFSEYLSRTFDPAYVVKKGMDAIIDDLVGPPLGQRMIDEMIRNGKKQYLLEKLIPSAPDTILWEFTKSQMDWVKDNELNLYVHFTSQDMLYDTDIMTYSKFVNPSPNSPGLPPEAPGRTGNYIGYKIIEAYMDRSDATLEQMVMDRNIQNILNISRYKPQL